MKTWKKLGGLGLALCAWLVGTQAQAANPSTLNIDVTVNAALSVAVNSVQSSTYTGVTWNVASSTMMASASTTTITNDTGGYVEKWALSTPGNSTDIGGGGTAGSWTLSTSSTAVGTDKYAVQAVFGSSNTAGGACPGIGASDWNASFANTLTTSLQTYTDTRFADTNLTAGGGLATPNNAPNPDDIGADLNNKNRALCWRLVMPQGVTITDNQDIQIIVTAQLP